MSLKEIFLEGNPPWGFRMNGGADAGHPLRISRVNPGSKAEAKGVREGDLITSINGQSTKCLTNSESHALLRTVKENLLLGLNEDKNASPRRRSREIKSASIISQEKERSESPAQSKGNKKPSANQKRHQRRTRLKHRIKEMFGIKSKDKLEQDDEDWVIIDKSLKSETKSMTESLPDEEGHAFVRSSSEPIRNDPEEVYDNFEFNSNKAYSSTKKNISDSSHVKSQEKSIDCCQCITKENYYNVDKNDYKDSNLKDYESLNIKQTDLNFRSPKYEQKHSVVVEHTEGFITRESKMLNGMPDNRKQATLTNDNVSVSVVPQQQSALEVYISDGEEMSETLNSLPPCEMLEVCNATIMIESDKLNDTSTNTSNPIISLVDTDQCQRNQNSNPDYEPVEVNSSIIIYPPYSSTLNYYFPQRRYLEAIVEENSDISENNDEKQDKPWESSQLIREANNIESIPNDWYDSDEGIDTSWRDGRSIEEVTDVPIVTDSHSDSEFLNEDFVVNKLTRKANDKISEDKSKGEGSSKTEAKKSDVVLGKPPINMVNTYRISGKQANKVFVVSKEEPQSLPKPATPLKETVENKVHQLTTSDSVGNKVTCRLLKEDGSTKTDILASKGNVKSTENSTNKDDPKPKPYDLEGTAIQSQDSSKSENSSGSKLYCKLINKKDLISNESLNTPDIQAKDNKNQSENLSKDRMNSQGSSGKSSSSGSNTSNKYWKTTPSTSVLKNVVSSYYSSASVPRKVNLSENNECPKSKENVELSTSIIKPGLEKDIELIYIDSSDSDAISASNRTSLSIEKEEEDAFEGNSNIIVSTSSKPSYNNGHIIKEVITNINQSVKEISDICYDTSKDKIKRDKQRIESNSNEVIPKASMLPNLLSPVLTRKCLPAKQKARRRFSYPFSDQEISRNCNTLSCCNFEASTCSDKPHNKKGSFSSLKMPTHHPRASESSALNTKECVPEGVHQDLNRKFSLTSSKGEAKSTESVFFDFSEGSISSESYTLPDITHDNELLSDVSTDTIKYFGIPPSSPRFVPRSPVEVSDIVELHKKFVERRGYHEASPILKRKQEDQKTPEPDLIALTKCQERSEQAYTPELLAEAANLLALRKYHESRQKKMKEKSKEKVEVSLNHSDIPILPKKQEETNKGANLALSKEPIEKLSEHGVNETKEDNSSNKSFPVENETVGKSRLLELFQKLELKSSCSDCTNPEPFPYWLVLDNSVLHNIEEQLINSHVSSNNSEKKDAPCKKFEKDDDSNSSSENINKTDDSIKCEKIDGDVPLTESKSVPLPTGEIFQRRMYEEYLGKIAELAERRSSKVIKISSVPNTVNPPCDNQPLELEFMSKLKERNEKLGIVIDSEEICDKTIEPAPVKPDMPKHLKELMEITEECGGVWSPAQTPEAERKKFDFSSEIKEEKEKEKKEEDEKKEPQPAVWTPRSAGASPTLERKFRSVNFQSPPPTRREIKTSNEEKPELPQELPPESDKDTKSRLTSSSSENSTLSSSLKLPAAQNPTITLLQKAREGQIPRGAQYLEEQPIIGPNEIIYSVKKEHLSEDQSKKIVELGPRKIEGIGPTTKEGIPTVLRSEVKEDNQQRWYKRMYDSLHKADYDSQYPFLYAGGYSSEPERVGYDSDASLSKYATLDRRKIKNKENDFTTSTMPRNRYAPGVKYAVNVYKNQPGRIEDYEPGQSSIAERETKQWWDEVMDIFDGELNDHPRPNHLATKTIGKPFTYSLKDTGYESDSTLVFKRRENNMSGQLLSPADQKMAYKVIQKGGEVPLHGLRKAAPERPKEPLGNPIPTPPRDGTSRQRIQESPHRYVESEVNIHYRSPVRREAKAAWPEDELAQRQAEIMRRIYQEQKRTKYLNELHDMYSRRHADNLLPSQKSPIPLNRYDDFPVEPQPPRPRDRTPEPKLVARALYNFVGQTSRELSFRRGDIIYVRRQIDKNWYEGEHNAMVGLFPFNYVEIIPYDGIRTLPKKANEGQARAKFNFQAQTHLELSLVKGELVLLTRRVDENWFEGRIGNRKGIFPVSYVEVLVEPGERAASPSGGSSPSKPIVAPASHSVMLNGAKDLGQQHYQPPRPTIYASSSLPPSSKMNDISLVNQTLHIDTQSDPVPYRVMYNYRPQNEDELELKEGDIVYVMEKCDDGWYVGSLHRNGQFGTFPGNYVERIQ